MAELDTIMIDKVAVGMRVTTKEIVTRTQDISKEIITINVIDHIETKCNAVDHFATVKDQELLNFFNIRLCTFILLFQHLLLIE